MGTKKRLVQLYIIENLAFKLEENYARLHSEVFLSLQSFNFARTYSFK